MDAIELHPVGVVHREDDSAEAGRCTIEVRADLTDAMLGLEPGDRLQVLFWMSRLDDSHRQILQCHPRGDRSRPERGVFALRSPMRPNPIGSTLVEVKQVQGNRLVVDGLDAFDGTPVIDLKIAG
ncbi:MAG: tRNA (N6-threonylcarbamoyladenosine(37)-N6)-methyltransferase TrmO [Candidatus Brocadiaceae bacterium]|jgi:tRNA-Thr(GGU) m(6)t(6)A37 methyltransferase TsaA